jgi:Na+-transporting NADH:ubiquinone oxidoreductase subunit C
VPPRNVAGYTLGFAAVVCVVCAVLVSGAAVALRDRQDLNAELERKRNVLKAAGVMGEAEKLPVDEVERRFADFEVVAVDLRTGMPDPAFQTAGYDPRRALSDPTASRPAPPNAAQLARIPNHAVVYEKHDAQGRLELIVLPVEGKGLWSTMLGFLALGPDLRSVRGLAYYQHGETPGLGGEVDNPRWKALWPGRKVFDDDGTVRIDVIRGPAGPAATDPYRVDGLSGATLTSRGVTAMLRFWLGPDGYGPFLERLRKEAGNGSTT